MIKTLLSAISLLLLTGCAGFTPLHAATSGANSAAFKNISVKVADGADQGDQEAGFFVMQRLRDRIGENNGGHVLTLNPTLRRSGFGINSIDVASRYDSTVAVRYTLTDGKSGKVLTSGSVTAVSTFGAPLDPYGLIAADKNATQQTTKEAADRILVKLASYYANPKK